MNGPFIYTSTFNLVELKLKLLSNSNPHSRILTRIFVEVFKIKNVFGSIGAEKQVNIQ